MAWLVYQTLPNVNLRMAVFLFFLPAQAVITKFGITLVLDVQSWRLGRFKTLNASNQLVSMNSV
jgi:hypothetical protein